MKTTLSFVYSYQQMCQILNIDVLIRREEPDEFHCLCLIKAHRELQQVLNHPPPPLCGLEWLSVQCREGSVLYDDG